MWCQDLLSRYWFHTFVVKRVKDVHTFVKRYKGKCGLELVGGDLGNFHVNSPDIEQGCGEVYAIESFFLCTKRYSDHLESTCKEGKITDGRLPSMEGTPTSCIEYYVKVINISVLELY